MKKVLRHKHCVLAVVRQSQKILYPPQIPFPGVRDSQNLISWRWSQPLPTNPVWCGSMQAISNYPGNRPTNTQTGPITIHCTAASLARSVIIKQQHGQSPITRYTGQTRAHTHTPMPDKHTMGRRPVEEIGDSVHYIRTKQLDLRYRVLHADVFFFFCVGANIRRRNFWCRRRSCWQV